ncbi:MAG: hypothetical protein HDS81_05910 [Bacteroidales bacterium]|nr:hypothetical protein [Bacteroidales bacterium]
MKKLLLYIGSFMALMSLASVSVSCNDDNKNTWDDYEKWRNANTSYYDEQKYSFDENGNPEYLTVVAPWNPGAEVLIKYLNDRSKTEGNLTPLLTSTVDVKYRGSLYNGVAFDSSYLRTSPADSIFRTVLSATIEGWWIALTDMRVGDSAKVIIPYNVGYGSSITASIPPFSTLVFDVKLVDIPYYEIPN